MDIESKCLDQLDQIQGQEPSGFVPCKLMRLPENMQVAAAMTAIDINPANRPRTNHLPEGVSAEIMSPERLSLFTQKRWPAAVDLGVWFNTGNTSMKSKLLQYMNNWGKYGNIRFREVTLNNAQIRVGFENSGYWSYLGTDCLHIPSNQITMNFQGWSMGMPDSEWKRVVQHEAGHALGLPHEHMRRELVDLLDPQKTIAYFWQTQRWSADEVQQQVLTPLEDSVLTFIDPADPMSIMCYQLPGTITKNGQPIVGGVDIDKIDIKFIGSIYPLPDQPPLPPPPSGSGKVSTVVLLDSNGAELQRFKS